MSDEAESNAVADFDSDSDPDSEDAVDERMVPVLSVFCCQLRKRGKGWMHGLIEKCQKQVSPWALCRRRLRIQKLEIRASSAQILQYGTKFGHEIRLQPQLYDEAFRGVLLL